jgi:hypothetical protein
MATLAPIQFSLRAVRAEARESGAMHARWVLLAMILSMVGMLSREFSFNTAPGMQMISVLTNCMVVFQVLNLAYYASGFTEERDSGVIDLLLLSGGRRISIWLGILADRLVRPLVLLAVVAPILMLGVALGGVDPNMLVHAIWKIVKAILVFHAMGAVVSTLMPTTFSSACACYLLVLSLVLGIPVLYLASEALDNGLGLTALPHALALGGKSLEAFWDGLFFSSSSIVGMVVGPNIAAGDRVGLALIALGWIGSAFFFLLKPEGWIGSLRLWRRKKKPSIRPAEGRAIFWKQTKFSFPGRWFGVKYNLFWVLCILVLAGAVAEGTTSRGTLEGWAAYLAFFSCFVSCIRCTLASWTLVWPEINQGTWDSLTSTPMGASKVLEEKIRACLRHLPFELSAAIVACSVFLSLDNGHHAWRFVGWFCGAGLLTAILVVVGTFYFSLVTPLLAPGLAIGCAVLAGFLTMLAREEMAYLFFCGVEAILLWGMAWRRLTRDLPEG